MHLAAAAILRPLPSPIRHAVRRFLLLRSSSVSRLTVAVAERSTRRCASTRSSQLRFVMEAVVQQRRPRGCRHLVLGPDLSQSRHW